MNPPRTIHASGRVARPQTAFRLGALLLAGLGAAGCQTPDTPRPPVATTQTDRLVQTYPELESGRFATIADFEDPVHLELVQLVSVSPHARWTHEVRGGRPETGGNALAFTSASPNDVLVLNNQHADRWYLKRDWRAYDLLLMSIRSPQSAVTANLAVGTGNAAARRFSETSLPLSVGWNVVRLDLAELGESQPLDDIQELRLSLQPSSSAPVVVQVDDILLVSLRETLWGDPRGPEGRTYAQRVGRRFRVGVTGRFELAFAGGLVVEAYNLVTDPSRLQNLARRGSLTPIPVRLGPNGLPLADSSIRQRHFVESTQRLVEANALRMIVDGEWRLEPSGSADPAASDSPALPARWRTVIHRTGDVFMTVELSPEATGRAGLVWTAADFAADRTRLCPPKASADPTAAPLCALWNGSESATAGLIRIYNPGELRLIDQRNPVERTVSLLVAPEAGESRPSPRVWHAHWTVPGATPLEWAQAVEAARSYQSPPKPVLQVGAWPAANAPTEEDASAAAGFDRVLGQYEILPVAGNARLLLGRDASLLPTSMFAVPLGESRRAWVYVNQLLHSGVEFTDDGRALFAVEPEPGQSMLVEVILDRTGDNSANDSDR